MWWKNGLINRLGCLVTVAGPRQTRFFLDLITFTTTDIPLTINTHNTELQMVKVHINNTKHITIANIYIPPRDNTLMTTEDN